ncbi:patatin-like phospholipase family protein [Neptuniibacter caesariensis]|uniref:Patatin-like phospholipase family protein n=1 Tax=Neptuniibacter caesariensis TaxID=207954 RepID=A0A7U8GT59_NEPCE|nr:patatin-like phospholipase family protein [Neptuniibacter caesariensis]EAR61942.1 patatin-like phospholipase family protein [Oceanospirillum sp. MED92] [Neptuniibacter caesariensis]
MSNQSVSLVLGSGGARGLAHIGIINELEKAGYRIESISGCSIGALIGGVYAAGKLAEFEAWVRAIDKTDILSLLDLTWRSDGLVKGDKIMDTLVELVGDWKIEDLPIRFTAIAADIDEEREVWMSSGSLFDAIRASISLPMFFSPVPYKDSLLVDGGILNPVPIAPCFSDRTDQIFAVNLGGPVEHGLFIKEESHETADASFKERVHSFVEKLYKSDEDEGRSLSMYDVAHQAFDTMQGTIARQKLAAYPPDGVIEIPRNACGILEFHKADPLIELGAARAKAFIASQD